MTMKSELYEGSLRVVFEEGSDSSLLLIWQGRSEERDPADFLNPFLSSIVEKVGNNRLICDFRALEYMNSSTIPPVIRMIKKLHLDGKTVKIVFRRDSLWQNATFRAMRAITDTMQTIEISGEE